MRRIAGGAMAAMGLIIPMVGLTAGTASALTCPSGYTQGGSSNVCVPIYPGSTNSYPPSVNSYPFWLTAGTGSSDTQSASNIDRSVGSDTTLFMSQALGDLYNDAGLYGCNLESSNVNDCENDEGTSVESDSVQTDTIDNFNRTEILNGVNFVGSGNGLNELCGNYTHTDPVAFARTSKPATLSGCTLSEVGYAKDGVAPVAFQHLSPGLFGSPTYYDSTNPNEDGTSWPSANSGEIGAPAAGWLPGNPDNCVPAGSGLKGTACTGTPFSDVDNTPDIPGDAQSSDAFRLWCQPAGTTNSGADPRIEDWGELTNLSTGGATTGSTISSGGTVSSISVGGSGLPQALNEPLGATDNEVAIVLTNSSKQSQVFNVNTASSGATSLTVAGTAPTANYTFASGSAITYAVGDGTPIGVPIRIVGINSGSGTVATFSSFANSNSGLSGTNSCEDSGILMDTNAAQGPDPISPAGYTGNYEIALENNANQISTFAAADFPNDLADQAAAVATSIYAESNGVYLSNPNAGEATLQPGSSSAPSGVPLTYTASELNLNGVQDTQANELSNAYPTARTLFDAYLPSNVNATVGGFFNWLCDDDSYYNKGTDPNTGQNYANEISNIINNEFEFNQLSDYFTENSSITPADYVSNGAPNSYCDAQLAGMVSTGGSTLTYEPGGVTTTIPAQGGFTGVASDCVTIGGIEYGCPTEPQPVYAEPTGGPYTSFPSNATVSSVSGSTMTLSTSVPAGTYTLYFPDMPPVLSVSNTNS